MKIFFCPVFARTTRLIFTICQHDAFPSPVSFHSSEQETFLPTTIDEVMAVLAFSLLFLFFFRLHHLPSSDGLSSKVTGIPSSLIFTLRALDGCMDGIYGYVFFRSRGVQSFIVVRLKASRVNDIRARTATCIFPSLGWIDVLCENRSDRSFRRNV